MMDSSTLATLLLVAYYGCLGLLCVYGFHRLLLASAFHRLNRQDRMAGRDFRNPIEPPQIRKGKKGKGKSADRGPADRVVAQGDDWPRVLVQLPLYNERTVAVRLIDRIAELDYPRECLTIQVLDDSTDETASLVAEAVARHKKAGLTIQHVRRDNRAGFKAGALEHGLTLDDSPILAIFDADFLPETDFLRRTVPYLRADNVGMVQARWGHLNREYSRLTRTQAMLLDAHFVVEHNVRYRHGRFFNFNGTAGLWRRRAIEQAGGWSHDTLTEDMDLSYRAQLAGWQFVFLPGVEAPAELPVEMNAFKSQQYRWTKGSTQNAFKLLPTIWAADRSRASLRTKIEATIHLTANVSYLLMAVLAVLLVPAVYVRSQSSGMEGLWLDLGIFLFGTLAVADFFLVSQRWLGRSLRARLIDVPMSLAVGMGLCINNARAVVSAVLGRQSPFVRTPKYAVTDAAPAGAGTPKPVTGKLPRRYSPGRSLLPAIELLLGIYFLGAIGMAFHPSVQAYPPLPFFVLFAAGFLYCGGSSLWEMTARWRSRFANRRSASAVASPATSASSAASARVAAATPRAAGASGPIP